MSDPATELRSCSDYQSLMPALVAGTLADGRRLLVEDHARHCVPCRRALQAVRAGKPVDASVGSIRASVTPSALRRFALAAAAIVAVALGSWAALRAWPVSQENLVQVRGVDGQLFEMTDTGSRSLAPGEWIDGGRQLRTAKGGGARLQLADGSLIEVSERSVLEMVRRRGGTLVRVDRGSVIVEAAKQGAKTLDVSTSELLASVKGTIFAVSHGTKGSRVSVVEGEVEVEQGRRRTSLFPGDQLGSRATVTGLPFLDEVGWSVNAERYLAMLEEFRGLRSELSQLMTTESRYSTRLLDLAPADTVFYVALPNPTAQLTEVYRLVRERVAANPALFSWWQELEASPMFGELDSLVTDIQELSGYLGDETVVALAGTPGDEMGFPVVMSEVSDATALRPALEAKLAEIQAQHPDLPITLLGPTTTMVNEANEQLFVWIGADLMVVSDKISEIHRIVNGGGASFVGTPFHARIGKAYAEGAQYLGAVDLGTVFAAVHDEVASEDADDAMALEFAGLADVRFLVVERTHEGERAHTVADLSFAGPRSGVAAWLAPPAPMGALEFFSPDATFVGGFVMRDPAAIIDEIFGLARIDDENFDQEYADAVAELGFDPRADLVATLGGETAFGLDGPALPTPAWKVVVEVYDAPRLQSTIETLVERIGDEQDAATLSMTSTQVGGRTYYHLEGTATEPGPISSAGLYYTYAYGYLVAAPSQALVERALQYHDSGSSVLTSEEFRSLLPTDGYLDFSAVVFNRIGEAISSLASALPKPESLTAEQKQVIDSMVAAASESFGPALYCLYGEEDRIRLVSNGPSLVPFAGLETLFSLGAFFGGLEGAP